MSHMTPYEDEVLSSWSIASTDPFTVQFMKQFTKHTNQLLHVAGRLTKHYQPKLADKIAKAAREAIITVLDQESTASQFTRVERALKISGSSACTPVEIRMLPLEVKDDASHRLATSKRLAVTAQGATAGMLTSIFSMVPGLQALIAPTILADLYVTIRMMAQSAVQTGYSYGYSLHNAEDLPHLLVAMSPFTNDADLITAKISAHFAVRQAGFSLTKSLSEQFSIRLLATSLPAVGQLLDMVATRLAITLMEQQGTLLIPIAGAAVQGSMNSALAHASYIQARRYFQRLHFIDRYGEDFEHAQQHIIETPTLIAQ